MPPSKKPAARRKRSTPATSKLAEPAVTPALPAVADPSAQLVHSAEAFWKSAAKFNRLR